MNRLNFILIPFFIFLFSLIYLNKKVQIYIEGYELGKNYQKYNEYLDKKDYLMYNLTKDFSLKKLNEWVERNNFVPIENNRMFVFKVEKIKEYQPKSKLFAFLDNLKIFRSLKSAFAKEY